MNADAVEIEEIADEDVAIALRSLSDLGLAVTELKADFAIKRILMRSELYSKKHDTYMGIRLLGPRRFDE